MVLRLKARESRSPPGLPAHPTPIITGHHAPRAGWSSPVARQAHNLKVTGSNPVPATNDPTTYQNFVPRAGTAGSCGRWLRGVVFDLQGIHPVTAALATRGEL